MQEEPVAASTSVLWRKLYCFTFSFVLALPFPFFFYVDSGCEMLGERTGSFVTRSGDGLVCVQYNEGVYLSGFSFCRARWFDGLVVEAKAVGGYWSIMFVYFLVFVLYVMLYCFTSITPILRSGGANR